MQLLCTNVVFDTLLSDGGNSRGGASSVSKVPGNVKLPGPTDGNRALKSHSLPPQIVFLMLKKKIII